MEGKIEKVEGLLDGTYRIALLTPVKPEIRALMGKPVQITITEIKARRSLDANAYYWKLLTQLAEKIGISKPFCHNIMLRRYGQEYIFDDKPVYALIPETEDNARKVDEETSVHLRPTAETKTGRDGVLYRTYKLMRGSHDYNTYEMSKLIDGLVSECRDHDIETITPQEMERMMKSYEQKKRGV